MVLKYCLLVLHLTIPVTSSPSTEDNVANITVLIPDVNERFVDHSLVFSCVYFLAVFTLIHRVPVDLRSYKLGVLL